MSEDVEVSGERHTLKMTWGAIRDISKVEPAPAIVFAMLEANQWKAVELEAVLNACLKAGGSKIMAGSLIDEIGVEPARRVAVSLFREYFKVENEGKTEAAMEASPA